MSIKNNYLSVIQRVHQAAEKYHSTVTLLAVSKKQSMEKIAEAYELGQRAFGESYVQEGVEKIQSLRELEIEWHFIGPIQSNKTRKIAEKFDWVQSVDSLKLLKRLNDQRPDELQPLKVLLQFNVSNEAQKRGFSEEELIEVATQMNNYPRLEWCGLMAIPENSRDPQVQTAHFQRCQSVFQRLNQIQPLSTLSMGMSGDMDVAVANGSNMVRIGTDIFGVRD